MARHSIFTAILLLMAAQGFTDTSELNSAWRAYEAARDSSDVDAKVAAAADVLAVGRDELASDDERLPVLLLNYGKALSEAGQLKDASKYTRKAIKAAEAIYPAESIDLAEYWVAMGDVYGNVGDESNQYRFYRKALKAMAVHFGDDSERYGDFAMTLGTNLFLATQSNKSDRLLQEARSAYRSSLGETSDKAIGATLALGRVSYQRRDFATAELQLLEGLESLQSYASPEHVESELRVRALLVQALERQGKSEAATEHCVAIGRLSEGRGQQEYEPLYRVAPAYPLRALRKGQQGHVDLEFTIDESGFVADPKAVDSEVIAQTAGTAIEREEFKRAALVALQGFRYAPRVVDGEAVRVDGVTTRITFRIE